MKKIYSTPTFFNLILNTTDIITSSGDMTSTAYSYAVSGNLDNGDQIDLRP